MFSEAEVEQVLRLAARGLNQSQLARETGVSRTTIRNWLRGNVPRVKRCFRCGADADPFPEVRDHAYAYLLGLYLGDGWLTKHRRRVYRLHVALDRRYPRIIRECEAAVSLVMPPSRTSVMTRTGENCNEVRSYSQHWPCVLPQHAPGMKHERRIVLAGWQRKIVGRHPWPFLRGLIHSDGCRTMNIIRHPKKTYRYPRYFFSNRSEDIRRIFCEACDQLGIEWRQNNPFAVNVARRGSVALMDSFIGPKR